MLESWNFDTKLLFPLVTDTTSFDNILAAIIFFFIHCLPLIAVNNFPFHITSTTQTQMYSLFTGGSVLQYGPDEVNKKCPMFLPEDLRPCSIFADWEHKRLFVCFSTGVIAIYDMGKVEPIVCFRAAPNGGQFLGITWDGSYLIFRELRTRKVFLLDFMWKPYCL